MSRQVIPSNVSVQIGLLVFKVLEVDVTNSVLSLGCWIRLEWTDRRLRWNSSDYNGLKSITVAATPRPL